MKTIKALVALVLMEIIIAIPVVTVTYINSVKSVLPDNGNECTVVGKFDGSSICSDGEEYYHFKSNDGSVWWDLTETQMGFIPKANTEYALTYDNMGTTKANKTCDCWECECEVYDDEFVSIEEAENK